MKDRKPKSLFLCFLISVLGSIFWSELFLSQRNILAFKKNWRLETQKYLNPNIVTAPALTSTRLLQGYSLESDFDLGIVRILSEETITPRSGKLWFQIGDEGFVDFIFNSTNEGSTLLRLSTSDVFPSGIYLSDSSGKYIQSHPLKLDLTPGHNILNFGEGSFSLAGVDYHHPALKFTGGRTGIQISPSDSEVFFFQVNDLFLTFIPDGTRWSLYGRHFLILFLLSAVLSLIPGSRLVKSSAVLTGLGIVALLADLLVGIHLTDRPEAVKEKFKVLDSWWTPEGETLEEKFKKLSAGDSAHVIFHCRKDGCTRNNLTSPLPPRTGHRILLFGGSQSKYGLINDFKESLHFIFDRQLRNSLPDVETMNISTPGLFQDRVRVYGKKLDLVKPDTIIIESVILDEEKETIQKFLADSRNRGLRIILLRTPENLLKFGDLAEKVAIPELRKGLESKISGLPKNMQWLGFNNLDFIRKMKAEFNFIFLDPNEVFLPEQLNNSGQLFWDNTHMTIYGQRIFGEWLAREYLKLN